MSVRVLLESEINPETKESLLIFLDENLPNVRSFKGCLNVTVLLNHETHQMLFDEEWKSIDSHKAYLQFIESNGVLGDLSSFLSGPPRISYYQKLDL